MSGRGTGPRHRLIPAHAGKTPMMSPWPSIQRAHPRSRGENASTVPTPRTGRGSSPLTRGKRLSCRENRGAAGLIPAHAGKTGSRRPPRARSTAHPRSRGENSPDGSERTVYKGSSPLTRGKPRTARSPSTCHGLIPAHAGKTMRSGQPATRCRAHPRSRGENRQLHRRRAGHGGSSPLTRGKQQGWRRHRHRPGLIPAHAGKTHERVG